MSDVVCVEELQTEGKPATGPLITPVADGEGSKALCAFGAKSGPQGIDCQAPKPATRCEVCSDFVTL